MLIQDRALPLLLLALFLILNVVFVIGIWKRRRHFSKGFLVFASSLAFLLMTSSIILIMFTMFIGYNQ
jgi:ethanolamine transporter EutH